MVEQGSAPETNGVPRELADLLRASPGPQTEQAWTAFVERYSRILLHTAHSHANSYDDAMDRYAYVLEELRKRDFDRLRHFTGEGRSRLSTFLVVVARRLCNDYLRQRYGRLRAGDGPQGRKARERHELRRRLADMAAADFDISLVPDGDGPTGEESVRRRELFDCLGRAIDRLSTSEKLIIKLRFFEGLSLAEIAAFMDVPSQFGVHRRLKSALGEIRSMLEDRGVEDPRP